MIIVIAVLAIIGTLTTAIFSSFHKIQTLNSDIERAISLINKARSYTLLSKYSFQYGIHFESSRLVFFKGASFTEPNQDNEEFIFSPLVETFNVSLNGSGSDLIFQRLTGKTNEYGIVPFRLKNDVLKVKIITIEPSGIISAD